MSKVVFIWNFSKVVNFFFMNPSIYVKKRHGISSTVYHEKRCSKSSPGISDLATVVRNPWSKGDFALESSIIVCRRCQKPREKGRFYWESPFIVCSRCQKPRQEGGFARESPFIVCSRCQKPRQEEGFAWNHPLLFAAGVRNPGRKGDLLGIKLYYLQQVSETQAGRGIF